MAGGFERRRALRRALIAASIVGPIVFGAAQFAGASHPSSTTIQQHWDLLAESRTGISLPGAIDVQRQLPGGTSVMNPKPGFAGFGVVARHTNGSGSSARWEVKLKTGSTTFAQINAGINVTFGHVKEEVDQWHAFWATLFGAGCVVATAPEAGWPCVLISYSFKAAQAEDREEVKTRTEWTNVLWRNAFSY